MKSESQEQMLFVQWVRRHTPYRIFHIPNGGGRRLSEGAKLKAEGVSRGVPDLYIPFFHLWIEMKKSDGGVLSSHQKEWHVYLRETGHDVEVCAGCEAAIAVVNRAVDRLVKGG